MPMTDFLAHKFLDLLRGTAYTPAGLYLGYSTADPGHDGSTLAEPTDAAYARQDLTGLLDAAASRQSVSNAQVSFPVSTEDQGTVTHLCVFDALTTGNLLWSDAMGSGCPIPLGYDLKVDLGDLILSFPWS